MRIGAFSHIALGAKLGDRVNVEGPAHLGSEVEVEDDVCIGGGVVFATGKPILLKRGCHVGANATLRFRHLHRGARRGGTWRRRPPVRCHQTSSWQVIPRKVVGFCGHGENSGPAAPQQSSTAATRVIESKVHGVRAYELPYISDPRGNLTVGEFGTSLPFIPKRYFVTFDVPSFHLRGEHAHHKCEQFLVCVRGSCAVVVDDGTRREEFLLDRPTFGVYVPPMVWATEYKHSPDSTLLVFASHHYDPTDYIRDYDEFRAQARKHAR